MKVSHVSLIAVILIVCLSFTPTSARGPVAGDNGRITEKLVALIQKVRTRLKIQ